MGMGDDFEVQRGGLLPRIQQRRRRAAILRTLVLLLLIGAGIAGYLVLDRLEPETPQTELAARPTPAEALPTPPAPAAPASKPAPRDVTAKSRESLPALDASDALVREALAELSRHDALVAWLISDDLIRRFAAAVDNIAEGKSPRSHLPFLRPGQPFETSGGEDSRTISPASYTRYDPLTEVFASLDTEGSVRLYRRLEPLIEQAYHELGYPDRRFADSLEDAIDELLRTPVVEGPVALEQRVLSFAYRDPQLEALSGAQKQLLRTGPGNVQRIQDKLRRLAAGLGLSVDPALAVSSTIE